MWGVASDVRRSVKNRDELFVKMGEPWNLNVQFDHRYSYDFALSLQQGGRSTSSCHLGDHPSDPEAELDRVLCDDERRPGSRHDFDAFRVGKGDTLGLWAGDPLGDRRGEFGNGSD